MSETADTNSEFATQNPTECPACGAVGTDYDDQEETFTCPDDRCGVDTFHRGDVQGSQPPVSNYTRGADGRSLHALVADDSGVTDAE